MLIAGLIMLAFGLIFGGIGVWFYRKVKDVKTWPSVSGTVIESGVRRSVSIDDDGDERVGYSVAVQYRYTVAATPYTGARVALTDVSYGSRQAAEQRLVKYPPGGTVQVKYNPANPASALLEESSAGLAWVFGGTGAAIFIGGIVLVAMA